MRSYELDEVLRPDVRVVVIMAPMASEDVADLPKVTFRPVTPARWPDLERLFGERGACGGCWCMVWRLPRQRWVAGKGAGNKRALKRIVTANRKPGVLAYVGREAIGWCALAPRSEYLALERSRVLKPIDDSPVWSISCLFVARPWRRKGVSVALLRAAVDLAAKQGARVVEGYPVEPTMRRMPDAFAWTGLPAAFRAAGFVEVARRSKTRPIMRCAVSHQD
jgi:GNAT superfamily N-acetyltransferase